MTRTQAELHPIDPNDVLRFQEKLKAADDDGKFEILAQLLADEFRGFKQQSQPRQAAENLLRLKKIP